MGMRLAINRHTRLKAAMPARPIVDLVSHPDFNRADYSDQIRSSGADNG